MENSPDTPPCARRLKPYFQGRLVRVYIKYPLRKVLQKNQESSRLGEWQSYMSTYNIDFVWHTLEKSHTHSSLMSDFPVEDLPHKEKNKEALNKTQEIRNKKTMPQQATPSHT